MQGCVPKFTQSRASFFERLASGRISEKFIAKGFQSAHLACVTVIHKANDAERALAQKAVAQAAGWGIRPLDLGDVECAELEAVAEIVFRRPDHVGPLHAFL